MLLVARRIWRAAVCALAVVSLLRAASGAAVDVRVMTFNVWSAEDSTAGRQRIVDTIRQAGADLIGLQEVNSASALRQMGELLGYRYLAQATGGEAILSRYPILASAPGGFGALVELAPGHEAWLFNTHLFHAPYGPYQLNGIAYFGGRVYDPAVPANIDSVIRDQVAARGTELRAALRSATDSGALASGAPVFFTGDFNEASHLDWTDRAAAANVHRAAVAWPASLAVAEAGFRDSWRDVFPDEVAYPGRTWSPVYPSTYMNPGDNRNVQPRPLPEPQDRIDFVYYAGQGVAATGSARSGPPGGDVAEELEISGFPSDHNAVTSSFSLAGFDATRLTFRGLGPQGGLVPEAYGSRALPTPSIATSFAAAGGAPGAPAAWRTVGEATWPQSAGQLDASGLPDGSAVFRLLLAPDAGVGVSVASFDLLGFGAGDGSSSLVDWELRTAGRVLASGAAAVPWRGTVTIAPDVAAFEMLELRLQPRAGASNLLALDNVAFAQTLVPEPAGWLLAACGAGGLVAVGGRRRRTAAAPD